MVAGPPDGHGGFPGRLGRLGWADDRRRRAAVFWLRFRRRLDFLCRALAFVGRP